MRPPPDFKLLNERPAPPSGWARCPPFGVEQVGKGRIEGSEVADVELDETLRRLAVRSGSSLVWPVRCNRCSRAHSSRFTFEAKATSGKKPALDKDAMSSTFLKHKGAEAGEIDWRPTETIPEGYCAL